MGSHGGLLGRLRDAAQEVWDFGIEGFNADEVRYHLDSISATISLLELARARDMAFLDAANAHDADGSADIVAFFSRECGLTPEAASERVTLARQLSNLGATVEKVGSGELDFNAALVVAHSTAKMREEQRAGVEQDVLEAARRLAPGALRHEAEAIVARHDERPLKSDASRAREKRSFRIGAVRDGIATVSGILTAFCATELRNALEPYMKPVDREDRRTAQQRRHDALHQLARDAGAAPAREDPSPAGTPGGTPGGAPGGGPVAVRRGRRPQVVVVAGVEAMMGDDGPPPLLQGRIPISQDEFDNIIDDADISVALVNAAGNIAFTGKSARSFSPAKMRAIAAVTPYCAFQRCTRPAAECTGHHVVEFALGGRTVVLNGAPLCFAHQDRVHRDGWWVGPDGRGGWKTLPPNHDDNPRSRISPAEYRRLQREAILVRERKRAGQKRAGENGHARGSPIVRE